MLLNFAHLKSLRFRLTLVALISFQVLSFQATFFAAQKPVVVEKMKIEVLESASASNCAEIVVDLYIS